MSLQLRVVLACVTIALIPLVLLSWLSYEHSTVVLEGQIMDDLVQYVNVKEDALDAHYALLKRNATALASDEALIQVLTASVPARTSAQPKPNPNGVTRI